MSRKTREPAQRIKDAVIDATGLSCSICVAPNRLLAKIGSDLEKPNGLTITPVMPQEPQLAVRQLALFQIVIAGAQGRDWHLVDVMLRRVLAPRTSVICVEGRM